MGLRIVRGIEGDSLDYHVLYNAAKQIKDLPGIICEIGTRRGGSLKVIIDGLLSNGDYGRNVVCIDPYGNIDYKPGEYEARTSMKCDYTNDMRNEAIPAIYEYIQGKPINVTFMCMEDTEFFKRFGDGVPFYHDYKTIEDKYALVFFDGPHDVASIVVELEFYLPRSQKGTMWVFDDLELYPHDQIEEWLFSHGFILIEKTGRKGSYRLENLS